MADGGGGDEEVVTDSSSWALKSLWMVPAVMKSEDDCYSVGKQ